MKAIAFEKWQGTGNDFLVVEGDPERFGPRDVAALCDRHFGVGGDGVLVVSEATVPSAVARMTVLNADGSRPEMCGNGLRCVALFVADKRAIPGGTLVVDTDAGPRTAEIDAKTREVTVDMGVAVELGPVEIDVEGTRLRLARISMGNPHAVTFEDLGPEALRRFGRHVTEHAAFPNGTNFEIATAESDGSIEVVVWERGVGPTLACGTGACAVAAQACIDGRRAFDHPIPIRLPGGLLFVRVERDNRVFLRGPAERVFRGEITA